MALSGLAACDGMPLPGVASGVDALDAAPAVQRLPLLDGSVVAAGPNGYCADPTASAPDDGFAIFATCAALDADTGKAGLAGITTVQAGSAGSALITGQEDAFEAYLLSPQGAQSLSRTGDPATVKVQSTLVGEGAVSVRFTDDAPSDVAGEQALQWRAFVDLGGRLVTVSVRGLKQAPLKRAVGSEMLRQALAALMAANTAQTEQGDG